LSGTPVENNLGEIWSQFAFLMPGLLGERRGFARRFRTPIEKNGDDARRLLLARRLKPFLLRRTKGEVEADLPAKTEIVQRVVLEGDQRDLYETIRLTMHERVRREIAAHSLERTQRIKRAGLLPRPSMRAPPSEALPLRTSIFYLANEVQLVRLQ
jgi:SNF2 family DNA or RNA helicase